MSSINPIRTSLPAAGLALAAGMSVMMPLGAPAQEAAPAKTINLELNALEASDKGCRIAFVVQNGLEHDIDKAAYEIALFDKQGLVDRLMVLDFQDLPAEKTKVRRFDLADADCGQIGRVLINDATACEGDRIEPGDCIARLTPTTRNDIAFGK